MGYFVAASLPISAIDAAFPSGNSTGTDEMLRDARVDLLAGRHAQAEDKLRQVIAARPSSAEAHRFLGRARARQNDPLGALAAFQRAIRLSGKSAALFNDLGNTLGVLGKHETAIAAYRLAIEFNPDVSSLYMNLANAQEAAGDAAGAAATWLACARACPADPVARRMVGASLVFDEADSDPVFRFTRPIHAGLFQGELA